MGRGAVFPKASGWILFWVLLGVVTLVLSSGCVSPALERLIEVECAAHDADLSQWDELTDKQRKGSVEESRASWYEVRRSYLDRPLPSDLK